MPRLFGAGAKANLKPNIPMKYEIKTTRTEYQICRYTVEAASEQEAKQIFKDGEADFLWKDAFDAEEEFEEIWPIDGTGKGIREMSQALLARSPRTLAASSPTSSRDRKTIPPAGRSSASAILFFTLFDTAVVVAHWFGFI